MTLQHSATQVSNALIKLNETVETLEDEYEAYDTKVELALHAVLLLEALRDSTGPDNYTDEELNFLTDTTNQLISYLQENADYE